MSGRAGGPSKKKITLIIAAWLVFLFACWSVAYLLTEWLYRSMDWRPADYVLQVTNNLFSLVIVVTTVYVISQVTRPMRRDMLQNIVGAVRRIAKGDFQVTIAQNPKNPHFREVIESINDMAAELNQLETMRQEFISNVSHEIQSPLTSISGFARVLREQQLSAAERDRYLTIIELESKRLSLLSDQLLKLTSLESQYHPFEPRLFPLGPELKTVILSSEPQWLEKEIDVSAELDEISIVADKELLNQVWINLLHNSIKYTPHGGAISVRLALAGPEAVSGSAMRGLATAAGGPVTTVSATTVPVTTVPMAATLSSEREAEDAGGAVTNEQTTSTMGERVIVTFADTGVGISEEDRERIFLRFNKADRARNRAEGGHGLGLAIAKKIVDMHHGEIQVDSTVGVGTEFRVVLPLAPPTE
jgi:signal transduction histidine kinase